MKRFVKIIASTILIFSMLAGSMIQTYAYTSSDINSNTILSGKSIWGVVKSDGTLYIDGISKLNGMIIGIQWLDTDPTEKIKDVRTVGIGEYTYAYIKNDNTLWMFGSNDSGELGIGSVFAEDSTDIPQKVLDDVKTVCLGGTSYYGPTRAGCVAAIKTDGSLWMWGDNGLGLLGVHTQETSENGNECSSKPIKVMEGVKSVSIGGSHIAVIKTDGSLWMWGDNLYGQLGNGENSIDPQFYPTKIMDNVKSVYLGSRHSAVIKTDGSLWVWGNNSSAQLGVKTDEHFGDNENNSFSTKPIKIMDNVEKAAMGDWCSAAIKTDGSLWIWGQNDIVDTDIVYDQSDSYGENIKKGSLKPVKIMEDVKEIIFTDFIIDRGVVMKTDGSVWTLFEHPVKKMDTIVNVSTNGKPQTMSDISKNNSQTVMTSKGGNNSNKKSVNPVKKITVKNLKGKKVRVTWRKVKGAKGYQISYATNRRFKKARKTTAKANVTSKQIKKLIKKKTYYFRVRAYVKVNGKKVYGDWGGGKEN